VAAVDLIPFVLILLAFYLLIVRPGRNRARAAAELQERLAPGVQVMTTSGMYGTIVEIDEESVSLEISPGTTVRFAKAAVGQVRSPELADAAGAEDHDDADDADDDSGPDLRTDLDTDSRGDHTIR